MEDGNSDLTPPKHAISTGDGFAMAENTYDGEPAGIVEWHRKADGSWCRGWVPYSGSKWAAQFSANPEYQSWDVVQRDPLTLSPSILCRACGNHGFIRNGKWERA